MHDIVGGCFSAWKNTLWKTVVQKLISFQSWHSPMYPFTHLSPEKWFQQLFHYQTYHWSDQISERYFNRCGENSTCHLWYHVFLLLKWVHWHGVLNTADGFYRKPVSYRIFSFPSVWRWFNLSPLFYQSEIPLEHRKWTVEFIFTLTSTKL